jgi:hypothetical protein
MAGVGHIGHLYPCTAFWVDNSDTVSEWKFHVLDRQPFPTCPLCKQGILELNSKSGNPYETGPCIWKCGQQAVTLQHMMCCEKRLIKCPYSDCSIQLSWEKERTRKTWESEGYPPVSYFLKVLNGTMLDHLRSGACQHRPDCKRCKLEPMTMTTYLTHLQKHTEIVPERLRIQQLLNYLQFVLILVV